VTGSDTGVIDRIDQAAAPRRKNRVLVVDEEEPLTDLLTLALTFEGWEVETLARGTDAVRVAHRFAPDAILLDMTLPDISGVAVVSHLRDSGIDVPVIFLTGRSSLDDRLAAFAAGGDDYMTKPFGLEEVTARLRSVFRRSGLADTSLIFSDLVLDSGTGQAWRNGDPLILSRLETALLQILIERRGDPIDGTGVIRSLGLAGHPVTEAVAARAAQTLGEIVDHDAEPLVRSSHGTVWLEAPVAHE
jgi:two-component system OmpR family response regulator